MEYVLALDQATRTTGYCLARKDLKGIVTIKESGIIVIKDKTDNDIRKRMREMIKWLDQTLKGYFIRQQVTNVVLEEPTYMASNFNTAKELNIFYGMLLEHYSEMGITVNSLSPNAWRKVLSFKTGNRVLCKLQSIAFVKTNYKCELKSNDESDAICIATAFLRENDNEDE